MTGGPWTRSMKVVHGSDLVQSGDPWIPGPCFVLTLPSLLDDKTLSWRLHSGSWTLQCVKQIKKSVMSKM